MTYTDLPQSKALYEIFGDVETEKVWYENEFGWSEDYRHLNRHKAYEKVYPRHTTDTLLDRLPAEVEGVYILTMTKSLSDYMVRYRNDKGCLWKKMFTDKSLLTALVDLTKWLNQNGYLPKETK